MLVALRFYDAGFFVRTFTHRLRVLRRHQIFLALDIQHWSFCPSALDPDRYALFIFGAGHSMLLT